MLVLFETPAGYAVFKLLDEKKLNEVDNLYKEFETSDSAQSIVKLQHFKKFEDTTEALAAVTAAVEGKVSKSLKKLMKKIAGKGAAEEMAVADAKIGNIIKDKFDISCVCSPAINELMRGIRMQMNNLISGISEKEMSAMSLGLAHSLSRYKLKFSPDKVDTMIVQAISLLDDLDKELNNYTMRCREWYGWHFPELGKIVTDNLAYAKTVKEIGFKSTCGEKDLSAILPEDVEEDVKAAAEISMGTDISEEDIENVSYLADQIIEMSDYRTQLYDYLRNRMQAIAPNLTILVGELVGARLIAHSGSLLNLAKAPASTVQILGAEKALFRALKTKHDTPKYGLIYHASLVGQGASKNKGKISRMLAAKTSLAIRYDALGEEVTSEMGIDNRAKLEKRIRALEEGHLTRISGTSKGSAQKKYTPKVEVAGSYNTASDSTIGKKRKADEEVEVKSEESEVKTEAETTEGDTSDEQMKKEKKKKKKKVETEEAAETGESATEAVNDLSLAESPEKKKKKKKKRESEGAVDTSVNDAVTPEAGEKKKKKKKKEKAEEAEE